MSRLSGAPAPLASEVWPPSLPPRHPQGVERPRIGIAGIAIESSTFSPHRSSLEAFTQRRGDELRAYYPFLSVGSDLGDAAEWVPLLQARSLPGGAVPAETYAALKDEILDRARAASGEAPFDGFYLDIHGAMSVVGIDDAEGDLASALREVLGPDTLVTTSMDLHGNVSRQLLDAVDLITCYRMAPHEDVDNTRARAVHNLLVQLRGSDGRDPLARRPWLAWQQIPVLLPGEKTSTRLEPAAGIYARVAEIAQQPGVIDAAVWVGYAWADEPRCQAAVVVTGTEPDVIERYAAELASRYWDARDDFVFVGPTATLGQALDTAVLRAPEQPRPFVISDTGDNPTAGGAGDVSWTLGELIRDPLIGAHDPRNNLGPVQVVHASVFDPDAVAQAVEAGVGARVTLQVGGRVDPGPSGPVELEGVVEAIHSGDPVAGRQVVIRRGGLRSIITERRKPFHEIGDFTQLGIDPQRADVVIVKIGYLEPQLHELAADWVMALTPGGVDQDLLRLGHHRLAPGVHPFEHRASWTPTPVLTRRGES